MSYSARLREKARCYATQTLAKDAAVEIALVSGSVAAGTAGPGSDIDILALISGDGPETEINLVFDGTELGVERLRLDMLRGIAAREKVGLSGLRLAGRLLQSDPLLDRNGKWPALHQALAGLALDDGTRRGLERGISEALIDFDFGTASGTERARGLRRAAECAAILIVSARCPWFQNPKWTLSRLTEQDPRMAAAFAEVYGLDHSQQRSGLVAARQVFNDVMRFAGSSDYADFSLRRAMADKLMKTAVRFSNVGRRIDATYCAWTAVNAAADLAARVNGAVSARALAKLPPELSGRIAEATGLTATDLPKARAAMDVLLELTRAMPVREQGKHHV